MFPLFVFFPGPSEPVIPQEVKTEEMIYVNQAEIPTEMAQYNTQQIYAKCVGTYMYGLTPIVLEVTISNHQATFIESEGIRTANGIQANRYLSSFSLPTSSARQDSLYYGQPQANGTYLYGAGRNWNLVLNGSSIVLRC